MTTIDPGNDNQSQFKETITSFLITLTSKNTLPVQLKEKEEIHKQLVREYDDAAFITFNQAEQIYSAADEIQRLKAKINEVDADHERKTEELVKYFKHLMNKKVRVDFMGSMYEVRYSITGIACHEVK